MDAAMIGRLVREKHLVSIFADSRWLDSEVGESNLGVKFNQKILGLIRNPRILPQFPEFRSEIHALLPRTVSTTTSQEEQSRL